METKICIKCGVLKDIDQFYLRSDSKTRRGDCAQCRSKYNYSVNKIQQGEYQKRDRLLNPDKYAAYTKQYKQNHPERILLRAAKMRAAKGQIPFQITEIDIVIPLVCPVLGIALKIGKGKGPIDSSPSLDRIKNELGYVPGNVRVISFRANSLRKDGTIDEFQKILEDLKQIHIK